MPLADQGYIAGLQHGLPGLALRGLLCAVALLAPTFLMGASLPALTRFTNSSPSGVAWWGRLYAGNILGAVAGCLLAGFYLLRLYDMAIATYAAVAINVIVALASWGLAAITPAGEIAEAPRRSSATVSGAAAW